MSLTRQQILDRLRDLDFKDTHDAADRAERAHLTSLLHKMPDTPAAPSVADLLATPAPFRDWLRSLPSDAEFACADDCDRCAIAAFLIARGVGSPAVSKSSIIVAGKPNQFTSPAWVKAFIAEIDGEPRHRRPLTPGECLAALVRIEVRAA